MTAKGSFKSLDEVVKAISGRRCRICGRVFEIGNFELGFYPHSDGWFVENLGQTLWIYAHCLNCGYRNAIWKLGL